jgi:hypothetical protein
MQPGARILDDTHFVFKLYRELIGFSFDRDESTRGMQREVRTTPVGSRVIGSSVLAQPRVALSWAITYAMTHVGMPTTLRTAFPPHGIYYYKDFPGASGSHGMPARIVYYDEGARRVKIVLASCPGLTDFKTDVDPATELIRRDTDQMYSYTRADLFFMYTTLGGEDGAPVFALFCDPLGFLHFGL